MPMFMWWVISAAIALIATRVAIDDQTIIEQVSDPIVNAVEPGLEIIGYGIVMFLIIVALGYAYKTLKK